MSDNNAPDTQPNKLPPMKMEEVIARAQRVLDSRGTPPYAGGALTVMTEDEAAVIGEFVFYWLPYLTIKEQK